MLRQRMGGGGRHRLCGRYAHCRRRHLARVCQRQLRRAQRLRSATSMRPSCRLHSLMMALWPIPREFRRPTVGARAGCRRVHVCARLSQAAAVIRLCEMQRASGFVCTSLALIYLAPLFELSSSASVTLMVYELALLHRVAFMQIILVRHADARIVSFNPSTNS
jgi:hypothetical protein